MIHHYEGQRQVQYIVLLTAYIFAVRIDPVQKTNSQRNSVAKQDPLAICVYGDGSSSAERGFCKPCVESSTLSRRPNFPVPLTALTASRTYLGLSPKAGLVPTAILMPLLEESNGQNRLAQLPESSLEAP
jgi:hypothetical protein